MPRQKKLFTHAMLGHDLSGGTGSNPVHQQIGSPVMQVLFNGGELMLVKCGHDHDFSGTGSG